ncbi:MAG: hypothetical protein ACTSWN_12260 [Promethearchaeota archaeon]
MGSELVYRAGIRKEPGYVYYIDKEGNIARVSKDGKEEEIVEETGIQKEPGYVYFLDPQGNVSRFKAEKRS